ncbi:MAG: FixH family protein [Chitinophagaceae bacterium]|nr:FixH family protein [Chitinophagaceae bacterium]
MKKILHSGNVILAGFAVMLLFMSYLVYSCISNPAAMVSDNYYEQEMTYQTVIDARHQFDLLQQTVTMKKENNEIIFFFPDSLNRQVVQTNFTFYNVANSHQDYSRMLKKSDDGAYHFSHRDFAPGSYRVKMQIESTHQQNYYHEIPLSI